MSGPTVKPDCRFFRGDKPCRFGYPCDDCPHYAPVRHQVLLIKARAQGDVLRTTPLLPGLRRKYPDTFLTWLTDPESVPLLENNPLIDRILPFSLESVLSLLVERIDAVICLDKEPELAALATRLNAPEKYGFGLNAQGRLVPLNAAAEYAYRLGMDDELKFRLNNRTYQDIAAEAAEVEYNRDEYLYAFRDEAGKKAADFFRRRRVPKGRPAVGLNTGSGTKFETKQWPEGHFLKLIRLLHRDLKANIFLLGGPREGAFNGRLLRRSPVRIFHTGTDNSLPEFAGFLERMDVVVCSDTLALHMAVALKKRTVALFGPTCPKEIDLYGRGVALFSGASCAPCYKQTCDDGRCMRDIKPEAVLAAVKELLGTGGSGK
ncbi:MAG: glycosyltransferase family 9 protein [Candidatus Aminicenantes bacterium]|nr:glycosyltransferase family 9 protein [Candidatus Aminicenantes bacterium]